MSQPEELLRKELVSSRGSQSLLAFPYECHCATVRCSEIPIHGGNTHMKMASEQYQRGVWVK